MIYTIIISIVAILALIICFYLLNKIKVINSNVVSLKEDFSKLEDSQNKGLITLLTLNRRVSFNEKDIERLETLATEYITQDDLDDFCESLYTNIQGVGERVKKQVKDEISSK
ncbi:hypothetical protein [Lachnospira sp.]|jgi:hypothetical protein|uniref:hypothetical protein n=1 Tax=Lachnospira sp. TaxID=2049031 RepID=UPI00257FACDC|nr:hypothetical protein [Lachnospira sp.]